MSRMVSGGERFESVRRKGKMIVVRAPRESRRRHGRIQVVVTSEVDDLREWSYWIDEGALFDPKKWRPA